MSVSADEAATVQHAAVAALFQVEAQIDSQDETISSVNMKSSKNELFQG